MERGTKNKHGNQIFTQVITENILHDSFSFNIVTHEEFLRTETLDYVLQSGFNGSDEWLSTSWTGESLKAFSCFQDVETENWLPV